MRQRMEPRRAAASAGLDGWSSQPRPCEFGNDVADAAALTSGAFLGCLENVVIYREGSAHAYDATASLGAAGRGGSDNSQRVCEAAAAAARTSSVAYARVGMVTMAR